MKGDFTRSTFRPDKHYSGVRMQQGRVQLDADWNEQIDIAAHRAETETIDVIGGCGAPMHDAGFCADRRRHPQDRPAATTWTASCAKTRAMSIWTSSPICRWRPERSDTPKSAPVRRTASTSPIWMSGSGTSPRWRMTASARWRWAGRTRPRAPRPIWQVKLLGPLRRRSTASASRRRGQDLLDKTQNGKLSAQAAPSTSADGPCVVPPGAGLSPAGEPALPGGDPRRWTRPARSRCSSGAATTARSSPAGWIRRRQAGRADREQHRPRWCAELRAGPIRRGHRRPARAARRGRHPGASSPTPKARC